jgi:hypothetical protein
MYLSYRNAALLDQAVITNLTSKTREGGIEEVGIRMRGIRGRGIIICFSLPKKHLHSQSCLKLHYGTIREAVKLSRIFSKTDNFHVFSLFIIDLAGRSSEAAMGGEGAQRSFCPKRRLLAAHERVARPKLPLVSYDLQVTPAHHVLRQCHPLHLVSTCSNSCN